MGLEGVLGEVLKKLVVEKDGKQEIGKYNPVAFCRVSEGLESLKNIDFNSKDGLRNYGKLVGERFEGDSKEKLEILRSGYLSGGQGDLETYVDHHFDNLLGEIDEAVQTELAYNFCLTKKVRGRGAKKFNETVEMVSRAKETIREIEGNPEGYLKKEIGKRKTIVMKRYLSQLGEELLELDRSEARRDALLAIRKYGANDFIKDTRKYLVKLAGEFNKKASVLQNKIKAKIEEAEVNLGRGLKSLERAELISGEYAELQKLMETYRDVELESQLKGGVAEVARRFISARDKQKGKK